MLSICRFELCDLWTRTWWFGQGKFFLTTSIVLVFLNIEILGANSDVVSISEIFAEFNVWADMVIQQRTAFSLCMFASMLERKALLGTSKESFYFVTSFPSPDQPHAQASARLAANAAPRWRSRSEGGCRGGSEAECAAARTGVGGWLRRRLGLGGRCGGGCAGHCGTS